MIWLFMALWLFHTALALARNLSGSQPSVLRVQLLQGALLALACIWGWQRGVFTRSLWSPVDIGVGLVLGHGLFAFALLLTHRHPGDVLAHLFDVRGLVGFVKMCPTLLARFFGVCLVEEMVYRVAAQDMLLTLTGSPAVAVMATAVSFCVLHDHFFRKGAICALEFAMFSLIIGLIYYYTASLTVVALIHMARNTESAYLEYCILIEDGRDARDALQQLRHRYSADATESL